MERYKREIITHTPYWGYELTASSSSHANCNWVSDDLYQDSYIPDT